jgi:periplasmic copper chaperone A
VDFVRRSIVVVIAAIAIVGAFTLAACGNDDEDDAAAVLGDLRIYDPWIRYTIGANAAAYLQVENSGADDLLIDARSDIAMRVELHEVVMEGATGRMQRIEGGMPVPSNGTLVLQPGGFHVMFMGLSHELENGEEVDIELVFQNAGSVTITAAVQTMSPNNDENGHDDENGHGPGMGNSGS